MVMIAGCLQLFESTYNSSFNGMNSTATGREDLYSRHTIDMSSSTAISKGDTIMVRFRLFSDPLLMDGAGLSTI